MKSHLKTKKNALVLGFIFASLLAALGVTQAAPAAPAPSAREVAVGDDDKVAGTVEAKSDDTVTVKGQTLHVNSATKITKDGASIKLGDINVGDKVTATTIKSTDGRLLAVTVEVTGTGTG